MVLRNTSASPCQLSGYPALQMVDGSGSAVPTMTVDGGHYGFTSQAPAPVTLAAGQAGSLWPSGTEGRAQKGGVSRLSEAGQHFFDRGSSFCCN